MMMQEALQRCWLRTPAAILVPLLLANGADPTGSGYAGTTTLMYAILHGHVALVRLLLQYLNLHGLDERDEHGCTALRYACCEGHVDTAQTLLLAGADHTIASNERWTARQVASRECAALLQWCEGELQRAYVLHKAKALHDAVATRLQAPAAPVPAYLSPRVQGGSVMPSVELWGRDGSGGSRTRGAAKRGAQEGKEVCAMVGYVVNDLAAELYIELLAGFHQ